MNKKIFISYSHDDIAWAQKNGHNLLPWLKKQFEQLYDIEVWWDERLSDEPGIDYETRIFSKIDNANLIIMLLSQNYAASKFIENKEEPRIMDRYRRDEAKILPIMLSEISRITLNNRLSWIDTECIQIFPAVDKFLINIINDKAKWESTKANLLDCIYNRITSTTKLSKKTEVKTNTTPSIEPRIQTSPMLTPQSTPSCFKKYWWIALCAVIIGVSGWSVMHYKDKTITNDPLNILIDTKNQIENLRANAEMGDSDAQNKLGLCYQPKIRNYHPIHD